MRESIWRETSQHWENYANQLRRELHAERARVGHLLRCVPPGVKTEADAEFEAAYATHDCGLPVLPDVRIAELEAALAEARKVIEAARCIRHWHDWGRDNEGMVVSSKHAFLLWEALEQYDAAREGNK